MRKYFRYLKIAEEEGDVLEIQRANVTLGNAFLSKVISGCTESRNEDLKFAEKHHRKSFALCESLERDVTSEEHIQMKARALLNIANVCEEKKQLETALDLLKRALNLAK